MSTCPVCDAPFDATRRYDGSPMHPDQQRTYCTTRCCNRAADQRAVAAYERRLAGALGPDGVAELREAASDGSTVVIEDLPPERRDGGLGPFGRAHRAGLGQT